MPGQPKSIALMTCQSISGSDYFGQVYFTVSTDLGQTWEQPQPIRTMSRWNRQNGLQEGVCDVVPQYHQASNSVLAVGHNVYYKNGALALPDRVRYPVYVVRNSKGEWSGRWRLDWDDPRATRIYTSGCAQRVHLADGRILLPLSFAPYSQSDRMVGSVLCEFDGNYLRVVRGGNQLRLSVKRGLLEPSITLFQGRYLMTIRAEDDHGYLSVSEDGLNWQPLQPWTWENGEPLLMSTTQQHWLTHSHGLFLVYTRQTENNKNIFRWRAPLLVAQVDAEKQYLIRETEQIVLPVRGDPVKNPEGVALMGNFHVTNVSPDESWVTVGENLAKAGWRGDTLLARIFWSIPNQNQLF